MVDISPSDSELIRQAIAGDTDAFGTLYERYMTAIYRYIYFRLGDARVSEDLTGTTFLRVWESLDRFQPDRISFRSWLYRVAHNLLVDRYRTQKPVGRLDDFTILDRQPNPEHRLIDDEESRMIAKAISHIKPEYQEVLSLRFISELSHVETARIMGRSEGAVRVLQHRALKALRKSLSQTAKKDS